MVWKASVSSSADIRNLPNLVSNQLNGFGIQHTRPILVRILANAHKRIGHNLDVISHFLSRSQGREKACEHFRSWRIFPNLIYLSR